MNDTDDILIEGYLRGTLSTEEQRLVEERIANDAAFREQFLLEQSLQETLGEDQWSFAKQPSKEIDEYRKLLADDDSSELKQVLQQVSKKQQKETKIRTLQRIFYSSAAVIAILLSITFLFPSHPSNTKLYEEYLQLESLPSIVSRGSEDEKDLVKAQQFFEQGHYSEVINLLNEVVSNSSENSGTIYLYLGISQMELNQYEAAVSTFTSLTESTAMDAEKGYWYQALLYIKQGQTEAAKKRLQKIVDEKSFNDEKAMDLLKKLE